MSAEVEGCAGRTPLRPRQRLGGRARALAAGGLAAALVSSWIGAAAHGVPQPVATGRQATSAPADPVLRLGSSGRAVRRLQRLLGVRRTGYFGSETQRAVIAYQGSHGIPTTGVVAALTWGALNQAGAGPVAAGIRPKLSMGMRSEWIRRLQLRLRMPVVTGYFGPITLAYVRAVQTKAGLPVTGVVDNRTWNKAGKVTVNPPTSPAPASTAPAQASGKAAKVLAIAASLRGIPYVAGGTSPATGFDCSGYTQYVYSRAGVNLGGSYTVTQYQQSRKITREQARPGDLIFMYNYPGNFIGHVGIYAGNGLFWHSPRTGRVVALDPIYTDKVYFGRVL